MRRWPTLMLFLAVVFPGTAAAGHYPPEINYLNQFDHVRNARCTDIDGGLVGVCAVFFNPGDASYYFAFHHNHRLMKVWRVLPDGRREVLWVYRLWAYGPPKCEGENCA